MVQEHATIIEQHLRQIADMLLLNGTLTECSGLVHGKNRDCGFLFPLCTVYRQ
jgi:hypothetical protein